MTYNYLNTLRPLSSRRIVLALASAVVVGAAGAAQPIATVAAAFIACAGIFVARVDLERAFITALAIVLAGLAFGDRGFAHIGIPPVYLGEITLALGLVAAAARLPGLSIAARVGAPVGLLLAYMALGGIRTAPYVSTYGIDALRDAVLWAYAGFALLLVAMLRSHHAERITPLYSSAIPIFLLWVPLVTLATYATTIPAPPGGSVPIVTLKFGDVGVHLAGIGAFLLLGLNGASRAESVLIRVATLPLFLVSLALVGIFSRGGLLAAATASLLVGATKPSRTWLVGALGAILLLGTVAIMDPLTGVDVGTGRSLSLSQLERNLSSIIDNSGSDALEGTEAHRLEWWRSIVEYTVLGPHFWTGKGFGVNLGIDDGFPTSPDDPARHPHNSHLTVLARMGVPGLVLWLAFLLVFAVVLVRALVDARAEGAHKRARLLAWLLIYWLAMLVNASFDPYLESPMGGIWFWSVVGYGLAVVSNPAWYLPDAERLQSQPGHAQ